MASKSVIAMALVALAFLAGPIARTCNGACTPSGQLPGKSGNCNTDNSADCCVDGELYTRYNCSPPVTGSTNATMSLNSFAKGEDGGAASECDGIFHSNDDPVVALSTGWYNGGSRCLKNIKINGNGKSVMAMVVDECDSVNGCDSDHAFQRPCHNNVVDASRAVWEALNINSQVGEYRITWSDA